MKPVILSPGIGDNRPSATLYYGQDVRESLRTLPEASVHTVCTSPPYWGLRSYLDADDANKVMEIGLEATPDAFVAGLVEVFREIKRVLRPDGTLWVNLGDSYARQGGDVKDFGTSSAMKGATLHDQRPQSTPPEGLKPKDLVGIPWRVAFALQADGWYLRQDVIWHKPNPMPESVTDRCTKAHEYLFLFAHPDSGGRYYYDNEAIKEATTTAPANRDRTGEGYQAAYPHGDRFSKGERVWGADNKKNKRSVWSVPTAPYQGAHFATWPPELVRPMVLAGCPVGGTVLDPFSGSATTGMVALQEGRNYIGTDLNSDYLSLAEARIREERPPDNATEESDDGVLGMFGSDE